MSEQCYAVRCGHFPPLSPAQKCFCGYLPRMLAEILVEFLLSSQHIYRRERTPGDFPFQERTRLVANASKERDRSRLRLIPDSTW